MKNRVSSIMVSIFGIVSLLLISACSDNGYEDEYEAEEEQYQENLRLAEENNVAYSYEFVQTPQVYEPVNACTAGTQSQAGAEFLSSLHNEGDVPSALRDWQTGVVLYTVVAGTEYYSTVLYVTEAGIENTLMVAQPFFAMLRPGDFFVYYDSEEDNTIEYTPQSQIEGLEVIGHDVFACLPQSA